MISPMTNARRRPMMSPILAPVMMSMAMTRQYRVMTAWIVVTVVWKSWTSALIETFITDWSSTMRNCAVAKATSASEPLFAVALFTCPLLMLSALTRNGSSPKESQILGVALPNTYWDHLGEFGRQGMQGHLPECEPAG